jgi:dienelactone hydrolase
MEFAPGLEREYGMIRIVNGSDKLIIVLHEIYGINRHMEQVCMEFAAQGYDVLCPDMLDRSGPFPYEREEAAYRYFMGKVGFEKPAEKIIQLAAGARGNYNRVFIVGFSAGASVAWLCSAKYAELEGVVGYYGSRIRNYMDVTPLVPVLLLFASEEKSFDAFELAHVLEVKKNTAAFVLDGRHGFADPYSLNYNENSAGIAERMADGFLMNPKGVCKSY